MTRSGLVTVFLMALGLAGCATLGGRPSDETGPPCRQQTAEIFRIEGEINEALAACVAAAFQPTTRVVVLNSPGGNVAFALDVAEHFEGRGLEMRVENECNSSCANYFLPLAGRIVVEPEALILLHGSLDAALQANLIARRAAFIRERIAQGETPEEAAAAHDGLLANLDETSARQAQFAARNHVPPGWLLYRQPGSDRIEGVSGEPDGSARLGLIVEETFMRSCLRGIEIEPFDARLGSGLIGSATRLIARLRGFAWTGEMRCVA